MASPYNGINNGVTFATAGVMSGFGQYAVFNGSAYIDLSANVPPALNAPSGTAWSVQLRFKGTTAAVSTLMGGYDAAGTYGLRFLMLNTSGNVRADTYNSSPVYTGNIADGNWHLLELSHSGSVKYFLVDGALVGSQADSWVQATSPGMIIGGEKDGSGGTLRLFAPGQYDEVVCYSGVCLHTASYTVPTAPVANNVANGCAVYHLDGTVLDSYGSPVGFAAALLGLLLGASGSVGPSSKSGTVAANLGLLLSSTGVTSPTSKSGAAAANLSLLLSSAGATSPTSKSGSAAANLGLLIASAGAAGPGSKVGTASAALGLLLGAAGATSVGYVSGTAQAALGLLLTAAGSGIAAVPVPFAPRARTSYPEPVFDPGSAPGDSPIVYIPVNKLWLPYIAGALTQLQQRSAWKALNQQQLQDLIGRVNDLIAAFGAGEQ